MLLGAAAQGAPTPRVLSVDDFALRRGRTRAIVEPVFGQLTEDRGFAALSLRGLALARAEYLLACLAHNLGKLPQLCPLPAAPAPATAR